jgi:transcriptional regulator with XRE-family HTH domain
VDEVTDRFAKALALYRRKKKLSLYALSRESGVDQANISRIERGICSPLWRTAVALADALGVKVEVFRGG